MLPGKTYAIDDYALILWTRKWFVIVPAVVVAVATATWAYYLPNVYRSTATIVVVPPQVPRSIVQSTVTASVAERLASMTQQILSRARLERIIQEFNLFPRERETQIMEDVVANMRALNIRVDVPRARRNENTTAFTISFDSAQPRTAQQVTERLAAMFVEENLQNREQLADSTTQFLKTELDDARRRLVEREAQIEAFRREHAGKLPSQQDSNLQLMQTTQVQIQANVDGAARDRDRLAILEASIADTLATASAAPAVPLTSAGRAGEPVVTAGTAAQQLEAARAGLRNLELRLKPEHPDISRAKRVIAGLEVKAEAEALAAPVPHDAAASTETTAGLPVAAASRISAMRIETQQIKLRLEGRQRDDARLHEVLKDYARRIEGAPGLESQLTDLMRDYGSLQEQYSALLRKSEESKVAVNLERRQIGEQFRVIDPARMPERPISPNRARLNLMGLGGGLALGLGLVGLLAYRDTRLKTDTDVIVSLALPVLAVIPNMITVSERERARRRRFVLATSGSVATILVVAAVAWKLQLLQAWVR